MLLESPTLIHLQKSRLRDAYPYMGDGWNGDGRPDSQHVVLPITIAEEGKMELHWRKAWDRRRYFPEEATP